MTEIIVQDFLATFDDSCFPESFLKDYELLECLAQHELGETLLVKAWGVGAHCVAKCYNRQLLTSQTHESDLLKRLHHKGLPTYIGEYENEIMLCVVRKFAEGHSLEKLAREALLTPRQVAAIAVQLCDILEYLHGQNPPIIHRDIKPQNVIINDQGEITLIDFGISRAYNESSSEDTLCFGTRHYAAPEQYGFAQTDARSDIFSLGVLLCWLLTGSVEVDQAAKSIPDRRLARIIQKCTAFAPKDRYQSAAQVRDALTGRVTRRRFLALTGGALVVLAGAVGLSRLPQAPAGVHFKEPIIEQAVRLKLGKGPADALTAEDLDQVQEIFAFGDQPAADDETFNAFGQSFVRNDGAVARGGIATLEDLAQLPNLRRVSLPYQNITDLTPLASLAFLVNVDFRHNPIADVSPLARVVTLSAIGLFDTQVADLTALSACPHLNMVDVGLTPIESMDAFNGLASLQTLMVRKAPLRSLEHIEDHPMLEYLYISETQVLDLSPLLNLPRLQTVEIDEKMRPAAEAIADRASFEIVYP